MKNYLRFLFLLSQILLYSNLLIGQQLSLDWASYYGGEYTRVTAIQYDKTNNTIYICGFTKDSLGIATPGSHKAAIGPFDSSLTNYQKGDLFLARFDTAGNRLWATYYGGENLTFIPSLSIDPFGNIYINGLSKAKTGIATSNGFYNATSVVGAGFLAKFNPQGQRIWGTYYDMAPFSPPEIGTVQTHWRTSFDATGNIYLVGSSTKTQGISTTGSYQEQKDTTRIPISSLPYSLWPLSSDAFIVKFDSTGQRIWGTYYGGEHKDYATAVYAEQSGNIIVAGLTLGPLFSSASTFVTPGTFLDTLEFGSGSFLAKFDSSGNRLWGTVIGGNNSTYIQNINEDVQGNIYIYGSTWSTTNIGTTGSYQPILQGMSDAFIMKFNSMGQRIWGTYFGGSNMETNPNNDYFGSASFTNSSLIIGSKNEALYISGSTESASNIATDCSYPTTQAQGGYIAKFDTAGQLLMGSYYDVPISDISLDTRDNIYFSSWTNLDSLATPLSFLSNKPQGKPSGLFGRWSQTYSCPSTIINLVQNQDTLLADTGYLSYDWYRNNQLVNTSNSPQMIIIEDGNYFVIAEGSCNCKFTSNTVNTIGVQIRDGSKEMQWSISPNPANKYLFIQGKSSEKTMDYRITDVFGNAVLKGQIQKNGPINERINIERLLPGLYVLQITRNFETKNFKFIKN
ncbi:MAG TPA: T9SS type A sorting domain-containing protein [Edaphocola sp.]|nr:T9SS type A sorting domain-containing protein [Edaphocola sp.]